MNLDWFEPRIAEGEILFPLSRSSQAIEKFSRVALEEGFTPIFVVQDAEVSLLTMRDGDGDYVYGDGLIEAASPFDIPVIKRS